MGDRTVDCKTMVLAVAKKARLIFDETVLYNQMQTNR